MLREALLREFLDGLKKARTFNNYLIIRGNPRSSTVNNSGKLGTADHGAHAPCLGPWDFRIVLIA